MKTHDFYFDLPQELIAQTPIERRDASRLLVLDKTTGAWEHRHFLICRSISIPATVCSSTIPVCCRPVCWVSVCRAAARARCCC